MKEKKEKCIKYCDSCLHVKLEKNELTEQEVEDYKNLKFYKSDYCFDCGQPLKASKEFEKDLDMLDSALNNKNLKVVCYIAPSVRVALGEEFGFEPGTNVIKKTIGALRRLGFYAVFDMNISADFTIVEEANEFINRLQTKRNLPMFTSCCPGWVNYVKNVYPKYTKNLSTCKSPQQMFGALINNFYAKENGFASTDMFVISIVPCLAKKLELKETGYNTNVGLDVDLAITTTELANYIKFKGLDFSNISDSDFDNFFGSASGAGAIFGNTGGVMEAVLRTVGDRLSNSEKEDFEYKIVRGLEGIKRAKVNLAGEEISLAVVTGLKNVRTIFEELKTDPNKYQLVEVMSCEGGCIGGPGQPRDENIARSEVLKRRARGLYALEKKAKHRKAHLNPAVNMIYEKYLGNVGGVKAKRILHRKY